MEGLYQYDAVHGFRTELTCPSCGSALPTFSASGQVKRCGSCGVLFQSVLHEPASGQAPVSGVRLMTATSSEP